MTLAVFVQATCLPKEERTLESGIEMDAFLREVEKRAYRITAASIRDADEALDIVQDAMISLVRKYSGRPAEEWRPLFYRILKNRIRDWQRHGVVKGRVLSFFGGQEGETYDPVARAPGPSTSNPDEAVARGEAMAALEKELAKVPRRQREAFMLRNFEGLSVSETAIAMSCSEGSVKTHYFRAVRRLRESLGEHF